MSSGKSHLSFNTFIQYGCIALARELTMALQSEGERGGEKLRKPERERVQERESKRERDRERERV